MTDSQDTPSSSGPAPYSISREDAALQLQMSTRSIDRYIRRGKLRAKKVGKMVWIHGQDLEVIKNRGWQSNYEQDSDASPLPVVTTDPLTSLKPSGDISAVLEIIEGKLEEKDQLIQDLTYRLGKAEVELKNSIPLVDHKKVAFLLEDAKRNLDHERNEMENRIEDLTRAVRNSSTINGLLITAMLAALGTMGYMWYLGL